MTGYVPRWPFKFGKTYKEECEACLAEFLAGQNQTKLKQQQVLSMTRSLPSLRPVCGDTTQVRDHLNNFSDRGSVHSSDSRQCHYVCLRLSVYIVSFLRFYANLHNEQTYT